MLARCSRFTHTRTLCIFHILEGGQSRGAWSLTLLIYYANNLHNVSLYVLRTACWLNWCYSGNVASSYLVNYTVKMLEVPLKIEEHGEDWWRSCRCVLLHRLGTKSSKSSHCQICATSKFKIRNYTLNKLHGRLKRIERYLYSGD